MKGILIEGGSPVLGHNIPGSLITGIETEEWIRHPVAFQ
jgi:hypothetical protein